MRRFAFVLSSLLAPLVAASCGGGGGGVPDAGHDGMAPATCASNADCSDGLFCNGVERCAPGTPGADARGCTAAAQPGCPAGTVCSETMAVCTPTCPTPDADGDGHASLACGGDDCDDTDPNRYPGNPEVCDAAGHDEDCDPATFGVRDADGDGFPDALCCNTAASGAMHCGNDCNDMRTDVSPGASEVCDGVDNNCNGMIDEGVLITFYLDADHDGHGTNVAGTPTVQGCTPPAGYAASNDDCDDSVATTHPGAPDVCDAAMVDDDCDGTPNDPPGGCDCTLGASQGCPGAMGRCASGTESCIAGHWSACSIVAMAEVCNGEDDDCNGVVDDAPDGSSLRTTCWVDGDRDGLAPVGAATTTLCVLCGEGYTSVEPTTAGRDCNDADPAVRGPVSGFNDGDGDGYGNSSIVAMGCAGDPGFSTVGGDCFDTSSSVHPGQTAYFAAPYTHTCPPGSFICLSDPMNSCQTLHGGCFANTPVFDYDCNGTNDRQPANAGCGSCNFPGMPDTCLGATGGLTWSGTPACGSNVTHFDCIDTCWASSVRVCNMGATSTVPLPCR